MLVRDTFATAIEKRIEPIVKVIDRRPEVLGAEISNLVVTPQWEQFLRTALDAWSDAAQRDDEEGVGIWISGFYGSGKSLLLKVLGALLEGGDMAGQSIHDLFLARVPTTSTQRAELARYLAAIGHTTKTAAIGGNLHAMQATADDPLSLIVFKLFADRQGYTHNWPLAWAVEHPLAELGLTEQYRERAADRAGLPWDQVADDPEFHIAHLQAAAVDVMPSQFADVQQVQDAINAIVQSGVTPSMLVGRLRRWCERRDADGRRFKVLLQLDELGQWIGSGNANERTMQVQGLVETAAVEGHGRIWLAVTAHGDVQSLQQNVQLEQYRKILQRFATQCRLSNDDIRQVVEERLLRKTQAARQLLAEQFDARAGALGDLGTLDNPQHVYPKPDRDSFAMFYPYMPWAVAAVPDIVKGIAQAAGSDETLTGSNRTMIAVVQGAIIDTPGLLESPVGRLVALADMYGQLATDAPVETKTDLNMIRESVPDATDFTPRVARALFLLGEAEYIPTTLDNVTRSVVDSLDANLSDCRHQVKLELDRLVAAGYAKAVGDRYFFLSTQQRTFQDKVRARRDELVPQTYDLSKALREYDSDTAFQFDRVPLLSSEIALKLVIDDRVVRNPQAHVPLHVLTPLYRALDQRIADDAHMRQLSAAEATHLYLRMADAPELRRTLALALATSEVAERVLALPQSTDVDRDVARLARQEDLQELKAQVRRLLSQSVRGGTVFFRGTPYQLAPGESASAMVRATIAQLLPSVYPRFSEVPYRILNEEAAVRAALAGSTSNQDLQALGVYRADGTVNEAHPLLSTLRSRVPAGDGFEQLVPAESLRSDLERPPFGWDRNVVKVGLALLLRAGACRLVEGGRLLTDPADPDVAAALVKEQRFKGLRVQGVPTKLEPDDLKQVRGLLDALFDVKPPLVPATLDAALGEKLVDVARRAGDVMSWASTAQCPLPLEVEAGASTVTELLAVGSAPVRLSRFVESGEALRRFLDCLATAEAFRKQHADAYRRARDFFLSMAAADIDLQPVRRFVEDWQSILAERSVTSPDRWKELTQVLAAAQQAVADQIATWRGEADERLARIEADLKAKVTEAGVPPEHVAKEVYRLEAHLGDVRERLQRPIESWSEGRALMSALAAAESTVEKELANLRLHFGGGGPTQTRLSWSTLAGRREIGDPEGLSALLDEIRARVLKELEAGRSVLIE